MIMETNNNTQEYALNDEIRRLERIICTLIGENNGLRFIAGIPEKGYSLKDYELHSDEVKPKQKKEDRRCMIFDLRTKKRIV